MTPNLNVQLFPIQLESTANFVLSAEMSKQEADHSKSDSFEEEKILETNFFVLDRVLTGNLKKKNYSMPQETKTTFSASVSVLHWHSQGRTME